MTALRSVVSDTWVAWSRRHEGREAGMYLDSKALVTTAVGLLLRTVDDALALPWLDATGRPATPEAIRAEYARVAGDPTLARLGARAARAVTTLRLSEHAIDWLTLDRLRLMADDLERQFPAFAEWPADAQHALCSVAWAAGSSIARGGWPRLTAALRAQDFTAAADEVKLDESKTRGVIVRNVANRLSMLAAAAVIARGADPAVRYEHPDRVPQAEAVLVRDEVPGARQAADLAAEATRRGR